MSALLWGMEEPARELLHHIEAFCAETGMSERHFGLAVSNNHKLVPRIRLGSNTTFATYRRIMSFIEKHKARSAA